MKKMLKVFGIIVLAVCLIVSIAACDNNGDKDTVDVVAVSESEYASVEDALKGYVKEELAFSLTNIDGEEESVINAKYVSHESKGAVAGDAIKLSNDQKTNFVSAEKFAVKVQIGSLDKDSEEVFTDATQTVYVLKYGQKYKYMVATPVVGERVTNSYVKMLTDFSKYENCTVSGFGMEKGKNDEAAIFEEAIEYIVTNEVLYKVSYYDETRYNDRTPGMDENGCDRRSYVVKNGDSVAIVENRISEDKEVWTANAIEDIKTVKAYNKYIFEERVFYMFDDMPAAVYTKTANGFECKIESTEGGWATELKITVADGKVIGVYMKQTWTSVEDGKTYVDYFESDTKISDFGTTTSVTIPEYVTEALSQLA
ncbi:MAG: hypothetical protein K2M75_03255 [Clostridia bacterium]|nr:hypothetical protein [Clostridia bacterium]